MNNSFTKLISDSLMLPVDALVYDLSRRLADLFPDRYILETEDYDFDLFRYADEGKCSLHILDRTHAQLEMKWDSRQMKAYAEARNAFYEILWRGRRMHCLSITYGTCDEDRHYIIADREEDARAFFAAVCEWDARVEGEILVWTGSGWKRDKKLMAEIEGSSFDNLVLPDDLREEMIANFEGFFASRDLYHQHGVAWKRGLLLLGPPGNGKTHLIKAMTQRLGKPCLYVRSFKPVRGTVQQSIGAVFAKARKVAPCLLVLEDLDSLIDDSCRSFFLNEMDGFSENEGILIVASTNHPKKLDPALLERPSRFDRKIAFELPAEEARRRFLHMANERREPAARVTAEELDEFARLTGGFSFAYLKELGLSGLMAWVRNPIPGGMAAVMRDQVETLRRQMKTEKPAPRQGAEDEDDD
jgi:hypothetical protein